MTHNPSATNPIAQWHGLVDDAAHQTGYAVDDKVENYLVLTLEHFTTEKKLTSAIVALDFLQALESLGRQGGGKLREVGDECLLLAGLFPEIAAHKHVSIDYFVGIGQQAYHTLTHANFKLVYDHELFDKLSKDFPNLIVVLQAMRTIHKKPHH